MRRRGTSPTGDSRQGVLFDAGDGKGPQGGSLNFDLEWRHALNDAIAGCAKSREQIAAHMERLLGNDPNYPISKSLIDAWTGVSRTDWRFPLVYLPAFIEATQAHWLLDRLARFCGRMVIGGEQAKLAELGALQHTKDELRRRERELRAEITRRGRHHGPPS
jgi:hypothetical protein